MHKCQDVSKEGEEDYLLELRAESVFVCYCECSHLLHIRFELVVYYFFNPLTELFVNSHWLPECTVSSHNKKYSNWEMVSLTLGYLRAV